MSDDPREVQRQLQRRQLLKGAAAVAGISAAAGWASLAPPSWPGSLRDPTGELGKPTERRLALPTGGFAVGADAMAADLGIARGSDPDALVKGAIDAVGGITRFVSRGEVVVVKPNVAFDRAPPLGATSNPAVVAALVRLILSAGASEVRVCDNPIESPEGCFVRSGIQQAAVESGARVYLPTRSDFENLHTPGATWIETWPFFWRPFQGADKVIGIAPAKDHNLCRASMTTKNWYGLLGGRRNQFHQDIHGIISDLALMLRPTLVLLDGTRVLMRSGPTGGSLSDVKEARTLVASTDSLAADAWGWDHLLDRQGEELPAYFAQAAARGLGQPDYRGLKLKEVVVG